MQFGNSLAAFFTKRLFTRMTAWALMAGLLGTACASCQTQTENQGGQKSGAPTCLNQSGQTTAKGTVPAGAKMLTGGNLITFGDSLTAMGTWPAELARCLHMQLTNAAMGGITSRQALHRFDRYVKNTKPDFVTLSLGMNDMIMTAVDTPKVPVAEYKENMRTLIRQVKELGAIPVVLTVSCINETAFYASEAQKPAYFATAGSPQKWLDTYNEAVRLVAAEEKADLVDIAKGCAQYQGTNLLMPDGVHLAAGGNDLYIQMIRDYLTAHYRTDSSLRWAEPTLATENSPAGQGTRALVSLRPEDWFAMDPDLLMFEQEEDALHLYNTNGRWPEAHYNLPKAYVVPKQGSRISYDFTIAAGSSVSIILYFQNATPAVYQDGQYLILNPFLPGAKTDPVSGDLTANQKLTGSVSLNDLTLPEGALDKKGNVVFSGIKIFVAGMPYQGLLLRQLAVTSDGAPQA